MGRSFCFAISGLFIFTCPVSAAPVDGLTRAVDGSRQSSVIQAQNKPQVSAFCRAVFDCRSVGRDQRWSVCMVERGYPGKSGSGAVCDTNPAARRYRLDDARRQSR